MQLPKPIRRETDWPWEGSDAVVPDTNCPKISIITPSYNQADYIEETIRSILLQGYPNFEYIVMDGGSTDGTVDILRHYDAFITWVSEPDEGQADAINKGLKVAAGDILAYLNSDDVYLPHCLHTIAQTAKDNPDADIIFGDTMAIWEDGHEKGLISGMPFNLDALIRKGKFLPQQSTFWTRCGMEKAGLFDADEHWAMDHDYFIRLGKVSRSTAYIPQTLAQFRFHAKSKSVTNEEKHWEDTMRVCEKHGLQRYHVWWWVRQARHRLLQALPYKWQLLIRKCLNRPADAVLNDRQSE